MAIHWNVAYLALRIVHVHMDISKYNFSLYAYVLTLSMDHYRKQIMLFTIIMMLLHVKQRFLPRCHCYAFTNLAILPTAYCGSAGGEYVNNKLVHCHFSV